MDTCLAWSHSTAKEWWREPKITFSLSEVATHVCTWIIFVSPFFFSTVATYFSAPAVTWRTCEACASANGYLTFTSNTCSRTANRHCTVNYWVTSLWSTQSLKEPRHNKICKEQNSIYSSAVISNFYAPPSSDPLREAYLSWIRGQIRQQRLRGIPSLRGNSWELTSRTNIELPKTLRKTRG